MSRIKTLIIGLVLLLSGPLLTGCSALRLAYANGSQLSWWWLDGYFDFSREQAPQVKQTIDRWFDWHRGTQIGPTTALLAAAGQRVVEPTTPEQTCQWQDRIRDLFEPSLARAIVDFSGQVPGLGEAQFKHLEQRYLKANDEMRDEFLQPDAALRLQESIKRTVERAERIYGTLADGQLRVISNGVTASPFSPELWLAERQRRQRDTLQTLRQLVADKADREQRIAALKALVQRTEVSPNPDYRAYQAKLRVYNCALAAQIHNSTTAAQRLQARDNLRGWEEDLRTLVAPGG